MDSGSQVGEALAEAHEVLRAWGLPDGDWALVGVVPGAGGALLRPVVEVAGARYVLRCLPDWSTDEAVRFRQAFSRHLRTQGVPVPDLLPTATGHTWAEVDGGLYEAQRWVEGDPFRTSGPRSGEWLAAAATTLGELHQASADFPGEPWVMPEGRSLGAIARGSASLLAEAAARGDLSASVALGLSQIAEASAARIEGGLAALDGAPMIHIHGDYQPHHLACGEAGVVAVYDLDAAHLAPRVSELAYALLTFTGLDWGEDPGWTPPLAPDGLDVLRVRRFLAAYGAIAPPAPGEAQMLADAVGTVFPIVLANAALEDLIFPDDFGGEPDEDEMRTRLYWADAFWLWLDRYRDTLAQAWQGA